jgi:hypothetical protein
MQQTTEAGIWYGLKQPALRQKLFKQYCLNN